MRNILKIALVPALLGAAFMATTTANADVRFGIRVGPPAYYYYAPPPTYYFGPGNCYWDGIYGRVCTY